VSPGRHARPDDRVPARPDGRVPARPDDRVPDRVPGFRFSAAENILHAVPHGEEKRETAGKQHRDNARETFRTRDDGHKSEPHKVNRRTK